MDKFSKFAAYLLFAALLVTGCVAQAPEESPPVTTPARFVAYEADGYVYDTALGRATWYEAGSKALVNIEDVGLASFSGSQSVVSLADGRTITVLLSREGNVETVQVNAGVPIDEADHTVIETLAAVHEDAIARARHISTRNGLWMLALLLLGVAAAVFAPMWVRVARRLAGRTAEGSAAPAVLTRIAGIIVALVPVLVMFITRFKFR